MDTTVVRPSTPPRHRIDNYDGTESAYISYLEQKVFALTAHHQTCRISYRRIDDLSPVGPAQPQDQTCPAGSNTLQFVHWKEDSQPTKQRNPTRDWEVKAKALVQSTPRAHQWQRSIKQLGIHEVMCNGQAAIFILDGNCPSLGPAELPALTSRPAEPESIDLLGRLAMYARTAMKREVRASLTCRLANFQKFILLSSCAVLYHIGNDKEKVLGIVKICMGNVTDRYCVQILRTMVYLNQLVDSLSAHGWGDRASELLLIWNESPAWYFALATSPQKSLLYLKTALSSAEFTVNAGDTESSTPFFVPSLVQRVLEKRFLVARISHVLGYKHAHILKEPVNPWEYFDSN